MHETEKMKPSEKGEESSKVKQNWSGMSLNRGSMNSGVSFYLVYIFPSSPSPLETEWALLALQYCNKMGKMLLQCRV